MEPPPGSGSFNSETGRHENDGCYWDGKVWRLIVQEQPSSRKWPLTLPQSAIAGAAMAVVFFFGVAVGGAGEGENDVRAAQTTTTTHPPFLTGAQDRGESGRPSDTVNMSPERTATSTTNPNAAAIEANRVAMESRQASADAQATRFDRQTYAAIGEREYAVLARNPDAEKGKRFVLYGYITQFDSVTGSSMFRADTSALGGTQWYDFDLNTIVNFDPTIGRDVVNKDIVTLYAEVVGSQTYTTALGGNETALVLRANIIETTG